MTVDLYPWRECQGIAASQYWLLKNRRPCFLRRNLRRVLHASSDIGAKHPSSTSGNKPSLPNKASIIMLDSEDEEPVVRRAKRRRVYTSENTAARHHFESENTTETSSYMKRPNEQQLDGVTKRNSRHRIDKLIAGIGSDFALKIEIGSIRGNFPAATSSLGSEEATIYKAKCSVNIYQREKRTDLRGKLFNCDEILGGATQDCEIELADPHAEVAKISLLEPFIFGKETLLVDVPDPHYTMAGIAHDLSMSVVGGLAEKYIVVVKFEKPIGPVKAWPPLDLASTVTEKIGGLLSTKQWTTNKLVLQSTIVEVLKPHSEPGSASAGIKLSLHREKQETNLRLHYDIAWSTPPRIQAPRSKRIATYQELSGKERSRVAYEFDFDTPEAYNGSALQGLWCIFCRQNHQSIDELLFHLVTSHDEFQFQHLSRNPQLIIVKEVKSTKDRKKYRHSHLDKVFRLGQPRKQFDLTKHLGGDTSWIHERYNNKYLNVNRRFQASFFAFEESYICSPEIRSSKSASPQKEQPRAPLLVPQPESYRRKLHEGIHYSEKEFTAGPLYNTLAKEILKPGEPLSTPSTDETWLFRKHADSINDYSDVTPAEKEYLTRWDGYIMPQKITAHRYVAAALEKFVEEDPEWFIGNEERLGELGKHCTLLLIRGWVDVHCVRRVLEVASGRDMKERRSEKPDIMDTD